MAGSAWASISIGNGGAISIGQGVIDLAGGNLQIDGQLDVADGSLVEAGNIIINGTLEGGSGIIDARGDWINNGSFNAGSSRVAFVDDAGGSSLIAGASDFHDLSMTSTAGGAFVLESGTVQRISHALTILGLDGQPVQIESSSPPQVAQLQLEPGGSQNIAFVGVSDVHATGEHLAQEQTNQGGSGNDFGWFGIGLNVIPVPVFSAGGLILLLLALLGLASFRLSRTPV